MTTQQFITDNKKVVNAGLVFVGILFLVWVIQTLAGTLGLINPLSDDVRALFSSDQWYKVFFIEGERFNMWQAFSNALIYSPGPAIFIVIPYLLYYKYQARVQTPAEKAEMIRYAVMTLFGLLSLFMIGYAMWLILEYSTIFKITIMVCFWAYILIGAVFAGMFAIIAGLFLFDRAIAPFFGWVLETPMRIAISAIIIIIILLGIFGGSGNTGGSAEERRQARIAREKERQEERTRQAQQTPRAQIGIPYAPITPTLPGTINTPVSTTDGGPASGMQGVH